MKTTLDERFGKKGLQAMFNSCITLLEADRKELVIEHLKAMVEELDAEANDDEL